MITAVNKINNLMQILDTQELSPKERISLVGKLEGISSKAYSKSEITTAQVYYIDSKYNINVFI